MFFTSVREPDSVLSGDDGNAGHLRRSIWWVKMFHRFNFLGTATIILVLGIWELVTLSGVLDPSLLPSPVIILGRFLHLVNNGVLIRDTAVSMSEVLIGFFIAVIIGIPLGVAVGVSRTVKRSIHPLIELLRPIPAIAILPMAILWFGIGPLSKYSIIAWGAFFPIFINTSVGFGTVDPALVKAASVLGASRWEIFRFVRIMSAFPNIVAGLRLGMGLAFLLLVAAELIAANTGLGFLIENASTQFDSATMFVGMITIGLLGLLLNTIMMGLQRRVLKWQSEEDNA